MSTSTNQNPDALPFSTLTDLSRGRLFLVSGTSGAGKTSVVNGARALLGSEAPARVITYTTREPRPGEQQGVDYHFIPAAEFQQKIHDDFFIEYSTAYGSWYGSPRSILDDVAQGTSYCMVLDRDGIRSVKKAYPEAVAILIEPPSLEELRRRLEKRGQDSQNTIEERLVLAAREIAEEHAYTLYNYIIMNDVYERAVEDLIIIFQNERHKPIL